MNPLQAKREFGPDLAGRYNGAAGQRERIVQRLQCGPATRPELERECHAPSATKRVSELRRKGWRIEGERIEVAAPDGRVNVATLYRLAEPDAAQRDLFDPR